MADDEVNETKMDIEDEQDENLEIDRHHSDTGGSQVERKNELNAALRPPPLQQGATVTTPGDVDGRPKDELVSRTSAVVSVGIKTRNENSNASVNRRKKHRRGKSKKRKWKPYNKLTWEEKRELEDRETRRAQRIREERFSLYGQPVAPYNTTQFLMEDHNLQEPEFKPQPQQPHRSLSMADADDNTTKSDEYYYSSPSDEEEFLQKEFDSIYDNIHAERLSSMSKIELIQEYTLLEERMEKLEQRVRKNDSYRADDDPSGSAADWDPSEPSAEIMEKVRIFKQEIRKLMDENSKLRQENELLKCNRTRVKRSSASRQSSGRATPQSAGEAEVAEKLASVNEEQP